MSSLRPAALAALALPRCGALLAACGSGTSTPSRLASAPPDTRERAPHTQTESTSTASTDGQQRRPTTHARPRPPADARRPPGRRTEPAFTESGNARPGPRPARSRRSARSATRRQTRPTTTPARPCSVLVGTQVQQRLRPAGVLLRQRPLHRHRRARPEREHLSRRPERSRSHDRLRALPHGTLGRRGQRACTSSSTTGNCRLWTRSRRRCPRPGRAGTRHPRGRRRSVPVVRIVLADDRHHDERWHA